MADVDLYRVTGKAGQHLSVEIDSVRLADKHYGDSEFDLKVRLLDSDGKEIARNDDSALHVQDPIVSAIMKNDGDYFVEIKQRLFSSGGAPYLAHIGTNSRALAVFPPGGPAGKPLHATLLGDPSGDIAQNIDLPSAEGDYDFFNGMPSPLPLRVSSCENVLSDSSGKETVVKSLPAALNGIIKQSGQVDNYRIAAKKGERWRVRVFARSLGSPLDPRIAIHRAGSEKIEIEGDDAPLDARGMWSLAGRIQRKEMMDPSLIWEPKEDGDYVLAGERHARVQRRARGLPRGD